MAGQEVTGKLKVLVYSDDRSVRRAVVAALGTRLDPDLPELDLLEVATGPMVVRHADAGGLALFIVDGEATPTGGLGLTRQLKDEIFRCPPILVLTGRPQDAWLATWSRADAVVGHPIDPGQLAETVGNLLRRKIQSVTRP